MKDYLEMTQDLLKRRDLYLEQQRCRRIRTRKRLATTLCCCMVVFVGLGTWLSVDATASAAVEAAGKAVKDWVIVRLFTENEEEQRTYLDERYRSEYEEEELQGKLIEYTYDYTPRYSPDAIYYLTDFEFTWLPDGFVIDEDFEAQKKALRSKSRRSYEVVYRHEDLSESFFFDVSFPNKISTGRAYGFNLKQVTVNGELADYLYEEGADYTAHDEKAGILIWYDTENGIRYMMRTTLPLETTIDIAEGIRMVD